MPSVGPIRTERISVRQSTGGGDAGHCDNDCDSAGSGGFGWWRYAAARCAARSRLYLTVSALGICTVTS